VREAVEEMICLLFMVRKRRSRLDRSIRRGRVSPVMSEREAREELDHLDEVLGTLESLVIREHDEAMRRSVTYVT
jgi:hypothetical protein